jgi:hypothetical protein
MDWSKIGGLIASVAPTLATAVGGPLAGIAAKTVSNVLLGRPDGSPQELEAAIQGATPDQLAQLRKVDADFKIRMKELDIDLEKLAVSDRSNARQRELETKDWTPKFLAFSILGGYFASLFWLLMKGMPTSGSESVIMMLGALSQTVTAVVAYYFGSSVGSRQKEQFIESKGIK